MKTTANSSMTKRLSNSLVLALCASSLIFAPAFAKDVTADDAQLSEKVLDPLQFNGEIKHAYAQAKQFAKAAKSQFCYCGCDVSENHSSLLDCFTDASKHAADCKECTDEMHITANMMSHGSTIADVQQKIHQKYVKMYPFDTPSAAYDAHLRRAGLNANPELIADYLPPPPKVEEKNSSSTTAAHAAPTPKTDSQMDKWKAEDPKSAEKFVFPPEGPSKMANQAVKDCPELLSQVDCYCGCAKSQDHSSVMDCFTSNEAPECSQCQEIAAIAGHMHAQKATLQQVKERIKKLYAH